MFVSLTQIRQAIYNSNYKGIYAWFDQKY
jgi:hypothetical protein